MIYHLPESSPLPPLSDPSPRSRIPLFMTDLARRPPGVTILALLNFFCAGLSLLLVARVLLTPGSAFDPRFELVPGFPQVLWVTAGAGAVFLGIAGAAICLPLAMGLWRMRQWARVMALIVYIGGVLVVLCANFSSPITGSTLLSLAVGAGATIYLLRPETNKAFGELPLDQV